MIEPVLRELLSLVSYSCCWGNGIDDQADYFTSMNQWVTPEEREKMEKQFEEERRKKEVGNF